MQTSLLVGLATLILVTVTGCSSPYYGYTKEGRLKLTDQERSASHDEYQYVLDSKVEQRHIDKIDARMRSFKELRTDPPRTGKSLLP